MIRPFDFGFNDETSMDNHYQKKINKKNIAQLAIEEFEKLVKKLKKNKVDRLRIMVFFYYSKWQDL